jgi:hypothetical protein
MRDAAETPDHRAVVREFAEHFDNEAAKLPQIRQVLLTKSRFEPHIWAVIEGAPFEDSLRMPVYEAELASHDAFPDVPVSFRLISLTELGDVDIDTYLPQDADVIFQR